MADPPSAPVAPSSSAPAPRPAPRWRALGRRLRDLIEPSLGALEDDYRRHYLPADIAQTLVATSIAIGALVFFAYVDYLFFGWSAPFFQLLLLRAGLIALVVGMHRRLARVTAPRAADRLIFASEVIISVGVVFVNLSRPADYWHSPLIDVLLVVSFYTLIPQPLVSRVLTGGSLSLVSAAILVFTKVGIPPLTLLLALTALLMANALGLLVSTRLFNYRRDQYKALVDQRAAQAALEWLATTDSLTGSLNRRSFLAAAEQAMARYQRHGRGFSILIIDLDRFKDINDTYGHQAGDEALRAFTALVQRIGRQVDTFGRLGGEEFGLLMPETDLAAARQAAERLRRQCQALDLTTEDGRLPLTLSGGVVSVTPADANLDSLMRRADQALYRAKQAGRNRIDADE